MRFIFLCLTIYLIYIIIRHFIRSYQQQEAMTQKTINLVKCQHCALNLPENEALKIDGCYYCCKSCLP